MKYFIYIITSNFDNAIYVGSTNNLEQRISFHKKSFLNDKSCKYNYNIYQFIRENGGLENFSISSIEEFDCDNVLEARQREQYFINSYSNSGYILLNKNNAFTNVKQYRKDYYEANIENIKENTKKYRNENKGKYKEYMKNYAAENKEKIIEYRKNYSKEKSAASKRQYYEANKEKVLQKHSEKTICECGGQYTYSHKSRHLTSILHKTYLCNSS